MHVAYSHNLATGAQCSTQQRIVRYITKDIISTSRSAAAYRRDIAGLTYLHSICIRSELRHQHKETLSARCIVLLGTELDHMHTAFKSKCPHAPAYQVTYLG